MKPEKEIVSNRASLPGFKPLNPVARAVLFVFGSAALVLGAIGIYVPVLPTTPFLLLAALCYLRSSERLLNWLMGHPRIGPLMQVFLEKKALPLKVKVISLVMAWSVLLALALFVVESFWMKLLLLSLGVIKTAFMLSIKTLEESESH